MRCLDEHLLARLIALELAPHERDEVEEHVAACEGCRAAIAELAREAPQSPADTPLHERRGAEVGRYLLLEPLGSGAMGRVWAAYDSVLDRRVALKLLRPTAVDSTEAERAAVIREARAMARVSHPHVVAVHDAGTFGDRVFLAMELVEGQTLRQWLAASRPAWRRIVEVFTAAADALAAAHEAGVVHRDFKPENVLIDGRGRARVGDFGLARVLGAGSPAAEPGDEALRSTCAGTPAYMAPEVTAGAPADARSDQFSFCVALYEALCSQRPFAGATVAELGAAIRAGTFAQRRLPAPMARVLRRGLSADPAARYPSMAALSAELSRAARPWLRPPVAIAAAALVAVAGVAGHRVHQASALQACVGASDLAGATWTSQRARVHAAFKSTGLTYAETAFARTAETIEAWAVQWHDVRRAACEATRVRADAPREALGCLDGQAAELASLLSVMVEADAALVERSVAATYALPPPARCLDGGAAASRRVHPDVDAALAKLASARGQLYAARYAAGLPLARDAVELAHRSGDTRTEAVALLTLGELQQTSGAWADAELTFERAINVALLTGLDARVAEGFVRLANLLSLNLARPKESVRVSERAEAVIRAIGGSPELEARHAIAQVYVAMKAGDYAQAVARGQRAFDLAVASLGGEHPETISAQRNLAVALNFVGRQDEGLRHAQAAHRKTLAVYGPDHPRVPVALETLAGAYEMKTDYARAAEVYLEALALQERVRGAAHPSTFRILLNACPIVGKELRRFTEGLSLCRRALALAERTDGPESRRAAEARFGLGQVLLASGDAATAQPELTRARDLHDKLLPEGHQVIASILVEEAAALDALGRPSAALDLLARAVSVATKFGDQATLSRATSAVARLKNSAEMRQPGG